MRLQLEDDELSLDSGSAEPNLFATTDGRVLLSWLEPVGANHALNLSVWNEGSWSGPQLVIRDRPFFVNWADFPSVVETAGGEWVVHWLEKAGPGTYAYHVKLTVSRDGGGTWSEPLVPHRDLSQTEHGFVSQLPLEDGSVALVWLDGRKMTAGGGELEGEMSVRFTRFHPDSGLGPDIEIDGRSCECCNTDLVETPEGLLAAYRDRGEEELRNIVVSRYRGGEWSEPRPVNDDGWIYPGCPVNGPALAAQGQEVAVAWYTAPEGDAQVNLAFSTDGGGTFGDPMRLDLGRPLGRVDALLVSPGVALALWLETVSDERAAVYARLVTSEGTIGPEVAVGWSSPNRSSGFPKMVQVGDRVFFAWTDARDGGGIRVRGGRIAAP